MSGVSDPKRSAKRPLPLLGWVLAALIILSAALALGVGVLVGTSAGTTFLLQQAMRWLPSSAHFGSQTGTLAGGLTIRQLVWKDGTLDVRIDTVELAVGWLDLLDGALVVDRLRLSGVRIQHTAGPTPAARLTVLPAPPLPVRLKDVRASSISWRSGDSAPVEISAVRLAGRWVPAGVHLDAAELVTPAGRLTGDGHIDGDAPFALDGDVQLEWVVDNLSAIRAGVQFGGTLAAPAMTVSVETPFQATVAVNLEPTGRYAATGPFDVDLQALNDAWPALRIVGELAASDIGAGVAGGSGEAVTAHCEITATLDLENQPLTPVPFSLSGTLTAGGPSGGVNLDRFDVDSPGGLIQGSGALRWHQGLAAEFKLNVAKIKPEFWWETWPAQWPAELSGSILASLSRPAANTGANPRADPVSNLVSGPPERPATTIRIELADAPGAGLSGTLKGLPLLVSGVIETSDELTTVEGFKAVFGESRVALDASFGAQVDMQASVAVANLGAWLERSSGNGQLELTLHGDPATPDINLTVSGNDLKRDALAVEAATLRLDGTLDRHQASLQIEGAHFSGGDARGDQGRGGGPGVATGTLDTSINWQGTLARSRYTVQGYTAALSAVEAMISTPKPAPRSAHDSTSLSDQRWALVFPGREDEGNRQTPQDKSRWTTGSPDRTFTWRPQSLALGETCLGAAGLPGVDAALVCAAGAWTPAAGQGAVRLGQIPVALIPGINDLGYSVSGRFDLTGDWRYRPADPVHWQPNLVLTTTAFQLERDLSNAAERQGPEPSESTADPASGDVESAGRGETAALTDSLRLPPLELRLRSDAKRPWQFDLRQLPHAAEHAAERAAADGAEARTPEARAGEILSAISGSGQLMPDTGNWRNSRVDGTLNAGVSDLSMISTLVPAAADIAGNVSGTLEVGGRLGSPVLQGALHLTEGRFRLPEQGLGWSEVNLALRLPDWLEQPAAGALMPEGEDAVVRRIEIKGSAKSGQGVLSLDGAIEGSGLFASATGQLRITGSNVRVFNTDLAQISASPDLTLNLDAGKISLTGEVLLPAAQVRIRQRPASAVTVSDDQRLAGETVSKPRSVSRDIRADVDLRFGDAVQFTGFGLDARLAGGLRISQRGRRTSANGSITTQKGTYAAYGQKLAINRGRLIWSDTLLTRPSLDVDASRAPTKDITVGLRASGALDHPRVDLYSVPGMPQSEQLAWLLFGRPLQTATAGESSMMNEAALALGVRAGDFLTRRLGGGLGLDQVGIEVPAGEGNEAAALVLGKYLTPDLYVGYGLSLLEALSTLRIEYTVSRNWRVVTESSAERNSADVFYVRERP